MRMSSGLTRAELVDLRQKLFDSGADLFSLGLQISHFFGEPRGLGLSVGGIAQTPAWANFRAISHRGGAPGLYFVGDTVFPGAGTIGVTLSGLNVYRDVYAAAPGLAGIGSIGRPVNGASR